MPATHTHAEVRRAFADLVRANGLPEPDEAVDTPDSVLFLYDEPRVAVEVPLDDDDLADVPLGIDLREPRAA